MTIMFKNYTEDQLVEQPAIALFSKLGWKTVSAMEEVFGASGTLGRETPGEAVLTRNLQTVLKRFNPALPAVALSVAVDELTRDRSAMSPEAANREVWNLIREGVKVSIPDSERGGQRTERVRVIDWEQPKNNDFLLVSQMTLVNKPLTRI